MEAQISAQLRAASADVIANIAPAADVDDVFAMQIRHTTIACALGAINAAGV